MKGNVWRWENNITSCKCFSFTVLKSSQKIYLTVLVAEPSIYIELEWLIDCLIWIKHEDVSADWLLWYDLCECEKILSINTGKVM